MSELRGYDGTDRPDEPTETPQARADRIKELNALGDSTAFDVSRPVYDPLEHIDVKPTPAGDPPPGLGDRPTLLGLSARIREAREERYEQPDIDQRRASADAESNRPDQRSDAEKLADAAETPTETDNPYSTLGGPDSRYDPSLPPEEQALRREDGLVRAELAFNATNWPGHDRAGSVYREDLNELNQERYPDGVAISYEGCPEFELYALAKIELAHGFGPSRGVDFKQADAAAGFDKRPPNTTWHHSEDGRTMYLLDRDLHADVPHWGGVRVAKVSGVWDRKASDDTAG